MKTLKLDAIRIDGGTQARAQLNQDVVQQYSGHLKDGDVFPPVTVFFDGVENWLADGFHRYFAHKANGLLEIAAEINTGTVRDAMLYAYGANARRGLPTNKKDNKKIIIAMLKDAEWSQWSNRHIARHIGVHVMAVSRVRHQLEEAEEIAKPETKKYVREGKEKTMDTTEIGKSSPPPKEKPTPAAKPEDGFSPEEKIKELVAVIEQLTEENDTLKDQLALKQWDASDIEKMDIEDVLKELRQQIRTLEAENETLRTSRDMYQNRNAELMKTVKSLQNKLKKA